MEHNDSVKRVLVHLGYHKTGSSSIQQWLLDHAPVLASHMACYNLADGTSNPLKFAAQAFTMGKIGRDEFMARAREMADTIRDMPQDLVCITDEGLPGLPLGATTGGYRETRVYPRGPEIAGCLAEAFAEFDVTFILFERDTEAWLKSVHNQMFKQGDVSEDFLTFVDRYAPAIDWPALRGDITAAVETATEGRGRVIACSFEEEFAKTSVWDMTFFKTLDIPASLHTHCRAQLAHINPSVPLVAQAPKAMPMMVLGGSNSLLSGGWVNLLRREFSALADVRNLSIGACTTAMGLYRFLSTPDRPAEAPVLWEYGVNEYNHLNGGLPLDALLYHVEWLIQFCIRERRPLVPVLMRNRPQVGRVDDPYILALRKLFASYKVPVLDVDALLMVVARGHVDLNTWYSDDAHYRVDGPLPGRVAEQALMQVIQTRPPVQNPERAAHFEDRDLTLLAPQNAPRQLFDNSILSAPYVPFQDNPEVSLEGRALAAILVTSGSAPAVEIDLGPDAVTRPISTQVAYGPNIPARQLRQIVLWNDGNAPMVEGELRLRPITPDGAPDMQPMYTWTKPSEEPDAGTGNGLVAVLCEVMRT